MSSSPRADLLTDLDPGQAADLLARGEAVLLDVREPDEWAAGHAPQAEHLPLAQVRLDRVPYAETVIIVCRSGRRSGQAADLLATAGVSVHNLAGGMIAWAEADLPVVTEGGGRGEIA